jgi:CIC family chloride channel protein
VAPLSSSSTARTEYTSLVLVAALIGFLGAVASSVFQYAITGATTGFTALRDWLAAVLPGPASMAVPLVFVAGALVLLALERLFPGHTLGYGFPRFLEMVHLEGGRVKRRWMVVKTLGTAIALGAGASVGREGPIAQIGGSIGSAVAQLLKMTGDRLKLIVACGAAAGIATTFNAPIGSVMFAQEIVLQGQVQLAHFSLIVISTATAVITAHAFGTTETLFGIRTFELASYWELFPYALMGSCLGLLAVIYSRTFHTAVERAARLPLSTATKLLLGLGTVGVVGMVLPQNLADGYPTIAAALAGELAWSVMLTLAVAKAFTSIVSLASGAPGGLFGPIFFIGAMSGGSFRALSETLLPGLTGPRGSYALVGLAAFLAACTHAPLTAMFLLFETTRSYEVALPALITVILAVMVSSNIEPESIDTLGLARAGRSLLPPREQIMDLIPVSAAYHPQVETIAANASLPEVLRVVSESRATSFPVVDDNARLRGMLSLHDVRPLFTDAAAADIVIAADLCDTHAPTVTPETSLANALGRMEADDRDEIAVVDPGDPLRVIGLLSRADVIRAYNRTLLTMRTVPGTAGADEVPQWSRGYRVTSLLVPATWHGRTLRDLDCRARFGINVLAVEPHDKPGHTFEVPDPDRRLETGDSIVVAGPGAAVARFERLSAGSAQPRAQWNS